MPAPEAPWDLVAAAILWWSPPRGAGAMVSYRETPVGPYNEVMAQEVRSPTRVHVPVIASGGVGVAEHFVEGARVAGVTGLLAASVFHFGELSVAEVKQSLLEAGISVRPPGGPLQAQTPQGMTRH